MKPEVVRDFSTMSLAGISTRTLPMISERLIGRKISPVEISSVNKDLNDTVGARRQRDLSRDAIEKYMFIDPFSLPPPVSLLTLQ